VQNAKAERLCERGRQRLFQGEQFSTGANRGLLLAVRSTETRKSWTFVVSLSKAGAAYRSLRRF
jgi:hypothetical protein